MLKAWSSKLLRNTVYDPVWTSNRMRENPASSPSQNSQGGWHYTTVLHNFIYLAVRSFYLHQERKLWLRLNVFWTLRISHKFRCWSYVGDDGVGQDVSIGAGCDTKAIVEHELLHALGFYHEQSRSDRDDYVKIWWDQIEEGEADLFSDGSKWLTIGHNWLLSLCYAVLCGS